MAKVKPSAPATSHKLLTHSLNPDGKVVTGKDPKGVAVSICVEKDAKSEYVVVKKGAFTSEKFSGYNQRTKELFDLLCAVEGVPQKITDLGYPHLQVVKSNDKIVVVNLATGTSKSFAPDAKSGLISKECRAEINAQIPQSKAA